MNTRFFTSMAEPGMALMKPARHSCVQDLMISTQNKEQLHSIQITISIHKSYTSTYNINASQFILLEGILCI